ncbi:MAG TPA: TIGR01620 family protein [Microvirga sp.]|jgi:putative membrane protein|nr:TIGR01620 family protein [Microvirga sp.]
MTRPPRAYRLNDPGVAAGDIVVMDEPFDAIEAADGTLVPVPERRRAPWAALLISALSGLLLMAIGLGIEELIADLYALAPWLGYVALALAAVAIIAFIAIVARELAGLWREERIEGLRQAAADALAVRDHQAAKRVTADLSTLYAGRASTRANRARLKQLTDEIIDAEDRLAIAERELLGPLDAQAKRAIAGAAKQVSLVTAVSPRAIVDVAFVTFAAVRLLGTLARIYGGRPGFFGFLRLGRAALNHLAVTGGVAVGDSLMQQVLGLGLAARVSAKLGEGVLNGLMTARFGLAALAVCRPLPFIREDVPKIGDVAGELLSRAEIADRP